MATTEESLVYEAVTREGRAQGLEEPVGPGGRDRAAQLDHARDERRHPRPPRRAPRVRPQRRVLHRYAVVGGGGRPGLRDLDDSHAAGVGQRQPVRRRLDVHEAYSYCGDSIHMYTHCGTHIDTLNHLGFHGKFWNGWEADRDLGGRIWNKGGLEYPPVIARGVLLDVAGTHGVDVLRTATRSRPTTCRTPCRSRGSSSGRATSCSGPTRMNVWPDFDGYLVNTPGIGLSAAKWLCEEVGAMCIAGDTIEARGTALRGGEGLPCTRTCSPPRARRSSRSST